MDADLVLLDRWRGGDAAAGQALFKRHFAPIFRFFENKVGADADELAQQTFLGCVKSRDKFRGASSFRTYLFAIARHELYQYLREARRDQRMEPELSSIAEIATTAGSRLARQRQVERVQEAMCSLPVEQQVLLEMHYWYELEPSQLAEVFEIPPATARTKLFRAREALRALLGAEAAEATLARPRGEA